MVVRGALVGIVAGALVGAYRFVLSGAERLLRLATGFLATVPGGPVAWFAALAVLFLLVRWLVRLAPATKGSGIPQIEAEALGHGSGSWPRAMAAKFCEGALVALAGLSLGREGPSVQLGGLGGTAVSKAVGATEGERRLLVTCGAGAGMAAAFQAPLTGVMFAIEEIHRSFSAPLVIGTMASSVTAVFLVNQLLGFTPLVPLDFADDLPPLAYGFLILLGVAVGLLGAAANRGMFAVQHLMDRMGQRWPDAPMAVAFALAGVCAFCAPALLDGGDAILAMVQRPQALSMALVLALLAGKYVATNVSAGSGAPGGTLYPLVVMGALAGCAFGMVAVRLGGLDEAYLGNFVLLGIAALFSSMVQAPVTGCLLVFELTGSFSALLSLALVSLVAYVVSNLTKTDGYYEHLLGRLLASTGHLGTCPVDGAKRSVATMAVVVALGSRAAGCRVGDLDLPDGCVAALVRRCDARLVAEDDLVLAPADTVLLVVDGDAGPELREQVVEVLRGPLPDTDEAT